MSYKRPCTGDPLNDYFAALADFRTLAPRLLEAKTTHEFDCWLDKLALIDRRYTALYLKEHYGKLNPKFRNRISVRLGRVWDEHKPVHTGE